MKEKRILVRNIELTGAQAKTLQATLKDLIDKCRPEFPSDYYNRKGDDEISLEMKKQKRTAFLNGYYRTKAKFFLDVSIVIGGMINYERPIDLENSLESEGMEGLYEMNHFTE